MITNNEMTEQVRDLEYDIALLENELRNCEDCELYNRIVNELIAKKAEMAVVYDTAFYA